MKDIKAIVFDLGGVLVELNGIVPMLQWSELNLDEKTLWQHWLYSPNVRAFETGNLSAIEFAEQIVNEMQLSVSAQQFLEAFKTWPTGLFAGVTDLLPLLRKDFTLACLSNTNTLHWQLLMEDMGLGNHLDHTFASHLINKIKPDPDIFVHVIEALAMTPEQILFYDDNQINVDSAREFGMQAELVKGVDQIIAHLNKQGLALSFNGPVANPGK